VASVRESGFTWTDAALLSQIASQVAIAVENTRNFEIAENLRAKLAEERDRSKLLLEVNNALVSNLELRELFMAVSSLLRNVFRHDSAALTLYDEAAHRVTLYAIDPGGSDRKSPTDEGRSSSLDEAPFAKRLIEGRKPRRIDRLEQDPLAPKIAMAQGLVSDVSTPMIFRNKVVGILHLGSKREAAFSDADMELLAQIGSQVAISIENALAYRQIEALKNKLAEEKLYLEDEIRTEGHFEEIIGESPALKQILKQIERVAPTDSTILIRGETGTGKELIARAIHNLSSRRDRTLVKVNCAAIPMGLLESELFGHERGAFTGAIAQRIGRFELAHQGTLFLDEVGDIPLELQPKLLRVLQEQQFERLGSSRTQHVDVRLVAATNAELEKLVADRQYRSDLYYRLNVFPVTIPPLRNRPEDIPLLVRFFAQRFARRMKKPIESISAKTNATLARYHWPGNVRELENVVERAVILSQSPELEIPLGELKIPDQQTKAIPGPSTLQSVERDHILQVLEETKWIVAGPAGAAARLGMKRTTLQAKMRKLGISRRG
jgi:formate hydrogenlyase transcriptional activator